MASTLEFIIKARDEASKALESVGLGLRKIADVGLEPIAKISPTLSNAVGGLLDKLGPTGLAIGATAGAAVAAVGGMAALTKAYADQADALNDISQRTGATTEFLSSLSLVAENNGSSIEELGGSFNKMAKSLDAAIQKGGESAEAFKRLGVNLEDLQKMTPEQRFEALAKAVAAVEDPTERVALAQQVFGKSAASLIPTLNEIAERGLPAITQEAKELGIVISSDAAKAADEFNDELNKVMASGKGLLNVLGSAMLPAFKAIVDAILIASKAVIEFEQNTGLLRSTFEVLSLPIKVVAQIIGDLVSLVRAVVVEIKEFLQWMGLMPKTAEQTATETKKAADGIEALGGKSVQSAEDVKVLDKSMESVVNSLKALAPELTDVIDKVELAQFADKIEKGMAAAKTAFDAGKISATDYANTMNALQAALQRANDQGFAPGSEGAKRLADAQKEAAAAATTLKSAIGEALSVVERLGPEFKDVQDALKFQQLSDATQSGIAALKTVFDAGKISAEQYERSVAKLNENLLDVAKNGFPAATKAAADNAQTLEKTSDAAETAADSIMTLADAYLAQARAAIAAEDAARTGAPGKKGGGGGGGGGTVTNAGPSGGQPNGSYGIRDSFQGFKFSGGDIPLADYERSGSGGGGMGTANPQYRGGSFTGAGAGPSGSAYGEPYPTGYGLYGDKPSYAGGGVIRGNPMDAVAITGHGGEIIGRAEQIVQAFMEAGRRGGWSAAGARGGVTVQVINQGNVIDADRSFDAMSEVIGRRVMDELDRRR